MTTELEICRAAYPQADEGWAQYILWERTQFPFVRVTVKALYKAASRYARARSNDRVICDLCDTVALPNQHTCAECDAALQAARAELSQESP